MLSPNDEKTMRMYDKLLKELNARKIETYLNFSNEYDFYVPKNDTGSKSDFQFITNFSQDDLPVYKRAVLLCGKEQFRIVEVVFDKYGRRLDGMHAIWAVTSADLNDFWAVLSEIRSF